MAVRTKRLAVADSAPASTLHTIYTCPTGETTIVKDVRVSRVSSDPSRGVVLVRSGADEVVLLDQPVPEGTPGGLECWVVLLPGDEVVLYSEGGVIAGWISGTELEGLAD